MASSVDNSPVIICAGANDDFALGMGMTLYSALANMESCQALLYIIDMGISARYRRKLAEVLISACSNVQINWIKPDPSLLSEVPSGQHPAYARLLIPEYLPANANKVIYLDSDLVVEKNLRCLWEMNVDEYMILAVQDYASPYISSSEAFRENHQRFGLPSDAPYFNSGVMLLNVKRWRRENVLQKIIENKPWSYSKIHFTDQDGLNVVMAGRWKTLDLRWNVAISLLEPYWNRIKPLLFEPVQTATEFLDSAFILHFTTKKPWRISYNGPGYARFNYYLSKSGWHNPFERGCYLLTRKAIHLVRTLFLSRMPLHIKKKIWRFLADTFRLKWFH